MIKNIFKILFSLILTVSFVQNVNAESLVDLKAQFSVAKKQVRELRMNGASSTEVKAQMDLVKVLRGKIAKAQAGNSFSDMGN